jgi:hypothetical protein
MLSQAAAAGAVATAYGAVQALGRTAGSTRAERRASRPGDDVVVSPQLVTDHALTVHAPAETIWPWLTQMGWHRGGWYTPRWVDRLLFPENRPSLERLDPEFVRDLAVGDTIPDGPPGTAEYTVAYVDPPRALVLRSTSHVPPGWGERWDARILWTWSIHLDARTDGTTRVHLRVRGRMSPWWFAALYVAMLPPADLVMARGMLRGLKRRAETPMVPSHQAEGL